MKGPDRRTIVVRKLLGGVWLGAWIALLYAVAAPWRHLGGVEDERLRWLEAAVLLTGVSLGFTLGCLGRQAVLEMRGRGYARLLRWALVPPAALTALSIAGLTALGARGPAGVVVTALLAYWAGLDLAFGALPLMEGRSCRLDPPLDALERGPARRDGKAWLPPWEAL
jgi:hypothetical protein